MQIREKGKKILCIRTEYRPEQKRTVGVTVASFSSGKSTVPEEVCQQLTKEEVDQLKNWLSERKESQTADRLKQSLLAAKFTVGRAADALAVDSIAPYLSNAEADVLWGEIERLTKALKKAGHPRPKQTEKRSAKDEKTGELALDE